MKEYDFQTDLENTKYEKVFADWLKRCRNQENVEVSEGYFPDYDVKSGEITYEIKRDYWYLRSKNILVEYLFDKFAEKSGWIKYSKADFLVVFVSEDIFYILSMKYLKNMFNFKPEIWEKKEIFQRNGVITVNYVALLQHFQVKWYKI